MQAEKYCRVLIITDSLGCPRKETRVFDTWTDRLMRTWNLPGILFYTKCMHGQQTRMLNLESISEIEPNIIIFQIGIVDACRRALTRLEMAVASRLPVVGPAINRFCKKHHYRLTKLRNIHTTSAERYYQILQTIIDANPQAYMFFLQIAPAGNFLRQDIYNVDNDIIHYNSMLDKLSIENGGGPQSICGQKSRRVLVA